MAEKTIFQKIIDKELPADIVYEDDLCLAFRDIDPKAPTHVLLVPKEPVTSLDALESRHAPLLGHMWLVLPRLAKELGLDRGYRVVVNCGADGGRTVDYMHFHLLGGRQLTWPPG